MADALRNVGRRLVPESRDLLVLLAACAVAAAWVTLGPIHRRHQADSLIPTLVSLVHWTPFYWGQDRFGMLLPLVAAPVQHPLGNLLLQVGLTVFGGLAVPVLLARYVAPGPGWPLAGGLGAAALIALAPSPFRFAYLVELPFGVALALCLGGLLLVQSDRPAGRSRGRLALGVLLVGLAHWVNSAAGLPLVFFEATRGLAARFGAATGAALAVQGSTSRSVRAGLVGRLESTGVTRSLLVLVVGLVVGDALRWTARQYATSRGLLALAEWPHAWASMTFELWKALAPFGWPLAVALITLGGCLLAGVPAGRRALVATWPGPGAAMVAAILYVGPIAPMRWVAHNEFAYRYALPAVLLLQAALLAWAAAPLAALLRGRARASLSVAGAALIVAAAVWTSGAPSMDRVHAAVDERLGLRTADILALGATHIAGDYWCVWPAVFHANLTLYDRGERRRTWGIAFRSHQTWPLAQPSKADDIRIATAPGDVPRELLARYGLTPLVVVDRRPTSWLLRLASAGVAGEPVLERYDIGPPTCPRAEDPID